MKSGAGRVIYISAKKNASEAEDPPHTRVIFSYHKQCDLFGDHRPLPQLPFRLIRTG